MNKIIKYLPKITPSILAYYASQGKWKFQPHLRLIENNFFDILEGETKNLIVNMPPRHGKSEFISKYIPFWYLSVYPEKRIILVSYQASLAESWSRKIREMFINFGDRFNLNLNPNKRKANEFEIANYGGGLVAVGVGGSLTGKGADLLIIDDPIKNDAEANSITYRNKTWDWFNSTALTRLEPDGSSIIVMTRWHEDDITGRLLNQSKITSSLSWKHLSLPAIAKSNDALNRKVGEPLWENRFDINKLTDIKKAIGSYWFSALYQQEPVPAGHSIFKRLYFCYFQSFENYFELSISPTEKKQILKNQVSIMATMDLAISTKETADYTVALVFGKTQTGEILVIDVIRERFETNEHINLLNSIYAKYKPVIIGIENVQYQQSLIQSAIKEGLPIKSLRPDKDKISRALPIASLIENGKVYFRKGAIYLEEFENELLQFPKGKNDDQVDALSYIFQMLPINSGLLPV